MTPTQFLEAAAKLMEEQPEVRLTPGGVEFRCEGGRWGWWLRGVCCVESNSRDALAHIVAAWSERVVVRGLDLGRYYYDAGGDFFAGLLEAVKATIE